MSLNISTTKPAIAKGHLRRVHHIALNVRDMQASCDFYGNILGLHQLIGNEVPSTLIDLVASSTCKTSGDSFKSFKNKY